MKTEREGGNKKSLPTQQTAATGKGRSERGGQQSSLTGGTYRPPLSIPGEYGVALVRNSGQRREKQPGTYLPRRRTDWGRHVRTTRWMRGVSHPSLTLGFTLPSPQLARSGLSVLASAPLRRQTGTPLPLPCSSPTCPRL